MNTVINADPHGRIALQGFDPVAFHTAGQALKGQPSISAETLGYKYLFTSEANKELFEDQPQDYLPAYGGYCAYGVANEMLFPVEIDTWQILDGRLVLQFSRRVQQKFDKFKDDNIRKANRNWPKIAARNNH